MEIFVILLVFLVGICMGSFVGVLIYRTLNPDQGSPMKGRSFCDSCKRTLAWWENIPLVSFVMLKGKCRTCKVSIPWTYPVVEFVTGLLFVWWATLGLAIFKLTQAPLFYVQPVFWLVVGVMLIVIFFTDLSYGIIPDFASGTIFLSTLGYRLFLVQKGVMRTEDFVLALCVSIIAGGAFGLLYYATKKKGIGFGDVKFAGVMGLMLGFPKGLVGIFISFLIGGIVGGSLLLTGKKTRKQTLPFGPFMVIGTLVALSCGDLIWQWYSSYLW